MLIGELWGFDGFASLPVPAPTSHYIYYHACSITWSFRTVTRQGGQLPTIKANHKNSCMRCITIKMNHGSLSLLSQTADV